MGGCKSSPKAVVEIVPSADKPSQEPPPRPKFARTQTWGNSLATAKKPRLLEILRDGTGQLGDVWMQASFESQFEKVLKEHPYLEEDKSCQPHPLSNWLYRCRESSDSRRFKQAQAQLRRVRAGLAAERRPIAEAFRRFDLDSSGHIDSDEFRHMCKYLGWGEEDVGLMDLDLDGRVTLPDFAAFVGYMGGVHALFEKRRSRITWSRKDVCDYAGIAVGAHVRSHFYVRGRKSKDWKEGEVVAVGVEHSSGGQGPSTLGVVLEFGFGPHDRWKTRQVVPPHWVLGGVEDASVAAVMREVGILDEQQSFWAVLLPDSEMHAMRHLTVHQKAALKLCRESAATNNDEALEMCRERFKQLDVGEPELQAVLGWVQDLAPVIIHLDIDESGRFMETDEFYRSHFETKTGKGTGEAQETNQVRHESESNLFGGHYDEAKPFERVKYGALDVMNDFRGVESARSCGDSYLVLKDVRLRCTFTAGDSAGKGVSDMAVLDKYAHVLAKYSDQEIRGLVGVATGAVAPEREGGVLTSGAARLVLLRGGSEDPTSEWITFGFPGLQQRDGLYYFEVHLYVGCSTPQVGLLSSQFEPMPYVASSNGVGDDKHGWAVDGQNAARWHGGSMHPWGTSWPSTEATLPSQASPTPVFGMGGPSMRSTARVLSSDIVIGVAVDMDNRNVWFSTDGVWEEEAAFTEKDISQGIAVYPAISLKGRAAFAFGPADLRRHSPPEARGRFVQWPSTPGGRVRVDCPDLGDSGGMSIFKEVQVHGEVHLKRNVQRLVASSKYRVKPKVQRSLAMVVSGAGTCSGTYHRVGAREGRPLYQSDAGCVLYWDPKTERWRMHDCEDFSAFLGEAPADPRAPQEPPRQGWRLPDEARGVVDRGAFQAALEEHGVGKADAERLLGALAEKDGGLVYRVRGDTSLAKEWQAINEQPVGHDAVWEAAVRTVQQRTLQEVLGAAGHPALAQVAQVVETKHPYEANRYSWTREVRCPGSLALSVYFASKTCTLDARTKLTISAGGLNKNAAGPGARLELSGPGGQKLLGTLVECTAEGMWRARLDNGPAREQAACTSGDWSPKVGDLVEAMYENGAWGYATVTEILHSVDWYEGTRAPSGCVVAWVDDDGTQDCHKSLEQLRRPDLAAEESQLYGIVPATGDYFALCAETPRASMVSYEAPVGDDIAGFSLDEAACLGPFVVQGPAEAGPAADRGICEGWHLDLAASALGPSRALLAELLAGVGGVRLLPASASPKGGRLNDRFMTKLLNACFSSPREVLERLNGQLRQLSGVSLFFCSARQARLLPEAHVRFQGQRVGGEVRQFTTEAVGKSAAPSAAPAPGPFIIFEPGMFGGWPLGGPAAPKDVRPEGFLKMGPAQAAGVRADWILDVQQTGILNPGREDMLKAQVLSENPNVLLSLSDVTLVFRQPNPSRVPLFVGSGPADSERWSCGDLPGDSAELVFSSDGDGVDDPGMRWGAWALVLPHGSERLSTQVVDELADRWVAVSTKATGIQQEPYCEQDEWDESRLRALCERHGWEFEWMTEDGERRRRASERQGFFQASGQLVGAKEVAKAAGAVRAERGDDVQKDGRAGGADKGPKPKESADGGLGSGPAETRPADTPGDTKPAS
eukprot:CAMPEP_0168449428 /NCGR_PEP_ID=MMETSP0228-20121227/47599_1 /TAXON_ID=133427 /ORGANISM="Protoceratium reticulatum, Strain CCCM 535 (=CCMP 1889)" /LENGTH=1617 /DNA_ID=CAMNT_0008463981 /DNA_START=3 /DNA_END=4856 /DNA_ORIENTATION=-